MKHGEHGRQRKAIQEQELKHVDDGLDQGLGSLRLLPENVMVPVMDFLPGEAVVNFGLLTKLSFPYLHCIKSMTLRDAAAFPSFMERLRGEGFHHLSELKVIREDVVRAVVEHGTKMPMLRSLDLADVEVTSSATLDGLGNLSNLTRLVLPSLDDVLHDDPVFCLALAREVLRLPLTELEFTAVGHVYMSNMARSRGYAEWMSRI